MSAGKFIIGALVAALVICIASLGIYFIRSAYATNTSGFMSTWGSGYSGLVTAKGDNRSDVFSRRLSDAAIEGTKVSVKYDGTYFKIPYPGGDVPGYLGVCTDVLIRSYRKLGIDLQKNVHEDIKSNFKVYPNLWGLSKPDTNIDHRRVPNLMVFFSRKGLVLPITNRPQDYKPGDIVAWNTYGLTHIGIVVDRISLDGKRHMIVHNFGRGHVIEDFLFAHKIIGHFRYEG